MYSERKVKKDGRKLDSGDQFVKQQKIIVSNKDNMIIFGNILTGGKKWYNEAN